MVLFSGLSRCENGQVPTAESSFISPAEAAKRLGMSTSSVYRAIELGTLPAFRLRPMGALRIPADSLQPRRRP
jgi:excisionase family DNA binding protein